MSVLTGRDLIAIEDLDRSEIEQLMMLAMHLKRQPQPQLLQQKVVACCFFEASTRTRLSFESAVYHLGGSVIGFSDSQGTSLQQKGESLQDTIAVISHYADVIVMRHSQAGAAQLAATVTPRVPLINAGDGAHQHPTQTLLDLFTIQETQGRLDDLNIALVGDLKYGRTVHSLAQALIHFNGNHLFLISPTALAMPPAILSRLKQKGVGYSVHQQLDEVLEQIDILYMTRIQKERLAPEEGAYCTPHTTLCANQLKGVRPHLKVLHPLPRLEEINSDVDATPYAYYFQQVANGLYVRQALLALMLKSD